MIRDATFDDARQIAELLDNLHGLSTLSHLAHDIETSTNSIKAFIDSSNFVRVIDIDGKILGVYIGLMVKAWFGPDKMAIDLAWYVSPESRGYDSIKLVKQFIEWAKANGAKQIRPGVSTASANACEIYKRLGFENVSTGYCLNV